MANSNWRERSPQNEVGGCGADPSAAACLGLQQETVTGSQLEATVSTSIEFIGDGAGASTTVVEPLPATGVFEPTVAPVGTTIQAETTVFTVTNTPSTATAVATDPPSPAQATSKSTSNNGVSKGAVAGIAIGTCIIGAAIAFLVAFLLFKRRDRRFVQKTCPSGYPIYADSSPELVMVQKSAAAGSPYMQVSQTQMRKPIPIPSRVPVATPQPPIKEDVLAGIMPPPASEHEVQKRVRGLFAQLHRHVDTYYRDVHASITPSMDSDLASFGKDVDLLDLLQSCSRPTVALKHALVAFVLSITGPRSEDDYTLWPTQFTHLGFTPVSISTPTEPETATAKSLHRRLSVFLYSTHSSTTSPPPPPTPAIREAAEHFSLTFFPWATPSFSDSDRERDLAVLIGEALECRIWLFGQPGEWGFEWEGEVGEIVEEKWWWRRGWWLWWIGWERGRRRGERCWQGWWLLDDFIEVDAVKVDSPLIF